VRMVWSALKKIDCLDNLLGARKDGAESKPSQTEVGILVPDLNTRAVIDLAYVCPKLSARPLAAGA
jgi:hypothetical protein